MMAAKKSDNGSFVQKVLIALLIAILTATLGGALTFFKWLANSVVAIQVDGAKTKATGEATQASVLLLRKEFSAAQATKVDANARRIQQNTESIEALREADEK